MEIYTKQNNKRIVTFRNLLLITKNTKNFKVSFKQKTIYQKKAQTELETHLSSAPYLGQVINKKMI